MNKKSLCRI